MQKHLWAIATAVIFTLGCATFEHNPRSQYIKNVDLPLTEIRGMCLGQLPVGLDSMSSNGRMMRSKPFTLGKKEYTDPGDAIDRYVLQITILGDGRPYEVEILTIHERQVLRNDVPTYVAVGTDDRLTKELQIKVQTQLTKRREDRNIIDDFRVY